MNNSAKQVLTWVGVAAILTLVFYSGCKVGRIVRYDAITERTDTLYIRDTIVHCKPIMKESRIVEPFLIPVFDTVYVHDTLMMELSRTQAVYTDSNYRAVVSGFRPSLDTIQVYQTTRYVTISQIITQKQWRRFTYGVQLGIGAQYGICNRKFDVGPYLGIGIGVNF